MGESSVDQEIRKSNTIVHNVWKIWRPAPSRTGSYGRKAGNQAVCQMKFGILKLAVDYDIRFPILFNKGIRTALFKHF